MSRRLPGLLVLAAIAAIVGVALTGLIAAGGAGDPVPWRYVRGLVATGFLQAGLSTLLSLTLGALIALALTRRPRFPGRAGLIAALNVATVLPAIVTVFAMVAVFGRAGWLAELARLAGIELGSWVYGLDGILIAHVFFNAPLAARVFLTGLAAVAPEHWRLAAQLGMPPAAVFRMIDLPVLLREAAPIGGLIFLACFTSFAIVLALGGGPDVATLEVAIFEALRFEADFRRAAILAIVQIGVSLAVLAPLAFLLTRRPAEAAASGLAGERPDIGAPALRLLDLTVLSGSAALVLAPLAAVLVSGLAALASLWSAEIGIALLTSLAIGIPAGCLSVLASLALAALARSLRLDGGRKRLADAVGLAAVVILVVSPIALSAGLFVVLRQIVDPFSIGLPLIVVINGMMALPFTYRQMEPPLTLSGERYGRLADSLGIAGFRRTLLVDWPILRGPLVVALAMAIALSFGDLGVAAFFGTGRLTTLPLLLYEKLGAYRSAEAASVALLLAGLVLTLFLIAQRWSGGWLARSR